MSPSRTEFIASMEFGQCSVVSSDMNKLAHELSARSEYTEGRALFFLGENEENTRQCAVIALTPEITLPSGRNTQIILATDKARGGDVRICALTRGDVALPLVGFSRRKTPSECDYVQIGQEMTDESYVVVPADSMVRKDLLESTKALLDKGPISAAGLTLLKKTGGRQFLHQCFDIEDTIRKGTESWEISIGEDKEKLTKEAVYGTAFLTVAKHPRYGNEKSHWYNVRRTIPNIISYSRARGKFRDFLKAPSLKALRDGTAPGNQYPLIHKALITIVCRDLNIDPNFGKSPVVKNFMQNLDVDTLLAEKLGEVCRPKEQTIKYIGVLAAAGRTLTMRERLTFDEAESDFEFSVEPKVKRHKSNVKVTLRPVSQPKEVPGIIFDVAINRTANGQELELEEFAELSSRLGKVATAHHLST